MTERPQTKKPAYQKIADDLRAAIEEGRYAPGDRLPSETELMKEHGVSRGTVREAFGQLQAEWLTEPKPGSGVYVRTFRLIPRDAAERLARRNWGAGRSIWDADLRGRSRREHVDVQEVEAPEHIAGVFGLSPGERVFRRSRLHDVEGRVVQKSTSYLPSSLVAGTPITRTDTGPGGTYARLLDLGRPPVRFREEIRVRMPLSDEVRVLAITTNTPVIVIARTAFDAEDRPVEVNEMLLDSGSYLLVYDFTA